MKKVMFRISPELNDGDHWGVCKNVKQLIECIEAWAEEAIKDHPQDFSVSTIEMTDEEYNNIPEV